MMILATFRLCALGALLAGAASPALAAAPRSQVAEKAQAPGGQRADSSRSRRVELPFPLDLGTPDRAPRTPAPQEDSGPHPFRETPLKRASLTEKAEIRVRLSRSPDFS